jgi:hypothetical protein
MNRIPELVRKAAALRYCSNPLHLSQWFVSNRGRDLEPRPGRFVKLNENEPEQEDFDFSVD